MWGEHIVILGAGYAGQRTVQALKHNPLTGLHPVAMFDDNPDIQGHEYYGLKVVGTLDESITFALENGITYAILAIPTMAPDEIGRFMDRIGRSFRSVQFIPDLPGVPAEEVYASNLDGMLAVEIRNGLFSSTNRSAKRLLDLALSLAATIVLFVPLLVITLLVKVDSPGPAVYRSPRVGRGGKTFSCMKFRTMYVDAEDRLVDLLAENPALRSEYERYHKLENDPRVTRVGSFLRKYSLDELAQLYNVLRGDMSLVGPRPYLTREINDMGTYSDVILQAKPGITGLWQVSGRNELTFGERLELESHYVRNWTIWWDLILMAQTVEAVLSRRGAK